MKKATRKDFINELLEEVQTLIPAGEGFHYFVEHNSIYGGYRLVKVKDENGGHYGCFGGNGTEARIPYQQMIMKLKTIIAAAPKAEEKRPFEELLKELEFTKETEYYDYIIDSIVNGQRAQARDLIKAMSKDKTKEAFKYFDMQEGAAEAAQEAQNLIMQLL